MPEVRTLYEKVLATGPDMLLNRGSQGNLTLGHHDLHTGNILLPNDPCGRAYIIDWQNDWCWFGVKDLAFFFVFSLKPERCRQLDGPMLRSYVEGLNRGGVAGYGWDQAWLDYRLAGVELLFRPLGNRQRDCFPRKWRGLGRRRVRLVPAPTSNPQPLYTA